MGAGASAFKKRKAKASETADSKNKTDGNSEAAAAGAAAGSGGEKNAPEDEDSEQVAEGIDEVICRLAQAHPTQTQKRWELITRRLNQVMKKKRIPAQPIKALFAREGLCIPQCWVAEKAQAEEEKAVARARKKEEKGEGKGEGGSGLSLFGKKKATAVVAGDKKQPGKTPEEVEKDDSDEAGESDTELESDDDEGAAADEPAGAEEGGDQAFMYHPLSKYEVFSFMRRVHDRSSSRVTEEEDAVEEMERAEKMVGVLYEQLPAATLKQKSQENRMKASLWQDSLVYGETEVLPFLKVLVKLKRIHGHMMSAGGSFWDLGAGSGKLVIAAAMMHNFESSYGVECLEDLRTASRPILDRWRKEEAPKLNAVKAKVRVDFIFSDAMKQEGWVTEATLLFVHTNFSAKNLAELRKKAAGMKVGAICLSVSLPAVDDEKWGLLAVEQIRTSWGSAKLYIHEKLGA